jgi:hypothetical protein
MECNHLQTRLNRHCIVTFSNSDQLVAIHVVFLLSSSFSLTCSSKYFNFHFWTTDYSTLLPLFTPTSKVCCLFWRWNFWTSFAVRTSVGAVTLTKKNCQHYLSSWLYDALNGLGLKTISAWSWLRKYTDTFGMQFVVRFWLLLLMMFRCRE